MATVSPVNSPIDSFHSGGNIDHFDSVVIYDGKIKQYRIFLKEKALSVDLNTIIDFDNRGLVQIDTTMVSHQDYFIEFQEAEKESVKKGVLFHIHNDTFGLLECDQNSRNNGDDTITREGCVNDDIFVTIGDDQLQKNPDFETLKGKFSITPPSGHLSINNLSTVSPDHKDDPGSYIRSRYYNILYSPTTPLGYFPKTALSRLRVLCDNNESQIISVLSSIVLSTEAFDKRNNGRFGILKRLDKQCSNEGLDLEFELDIQNNFLSKYGFFDNGPEHELNTFINVLKVREAQMQLVVLLEILVTMNINESLFLNPETGDTKPKPKHNTRPTLVRKRKLAKKIIPTFLGMGVTSPLGAPSSQERSKEITIATLHGIIEKMGIWDTLYSHESLDLMSFVAYVLIPYFNKRLPGIIKDLVGRIKGLSLKLNSRLMKSSSSAGTSTSVTNTTTNATNTTTNATTHSTNPKLKKPTAKLQTNQQTFSPPIALKRSKSNLSSKNLHRRQVDFSAPVDAARLKSVIELSSGMKDSLIFGTSRKVKESNLIKPPSIAQVTSTPVKPRLARSVTEVIQTPSQPNNITSKQSQAPNSLAPPPSLPPPPTLSPIEQIVSPLQPRSSATKPLQSEILTSPMPIESSPIMGSSARKRKPGEPIAFESHSFLNSLKDSSPEDDGIFKRASVKKKK